ncbi:MAG: exodeoxyribonuclease VII large subunit [Planctomycetes bacterium]|nr:exodeoxyribonuclease VII large subunit [Planctomycetota bacterium]
MARDPFNPDLIPLPPDERTSQPSGPITVSQLTAMIRRALDDALPPTLHVVGELSNFKRHSSGHLYFTLKDQHSELSGVMWRSQAAKLKFAPEDGLEVIATGSIEVFERAGRYQLYVRKLEPRGVGALELAFRQLCEKLSKEGLFDERHKQALPRYPQRIVLITSPTGAAVTDILRTLERRFPCSRVLIYPVRVQGEGAAAEIAAALRRVNANAERLGGVDLLIVGRGGGSLEDLWAFNEEVVARAIFASRIPVISAVGHEVDVTIADLVADVRAATPTAAAELAVPVLDEVLEGLGAHEGRLARMMIEAARLAGARLEGVLQRGVFRDAPAMVRRREQIVDELAGRVYRVLMERLATFRRSLHQLEQSVRLIAPHVYLIRTGLRVRDAQHRLEMGAAHRSAELERTTADLAEHIRYASPRRVVPLLQERLQRTGGAMTGGMQHKLSLLSERVLRNEEVLSAMSYRSVLERGFSITRIKVGRAVVRSAEQLRDRDRIITELADGEFEAEVVNLNQLELFE